MEACFQALDRQSQKDFCVLVVDNGSTDKSVAWMKKNLPGLKRLRENACRERARSRRKKSEKTARAEAFRFICWRSQKTPDFPQR